MYTIACTAASVHVDCRSLTADAFDVANEPPAGHAADERAAHEQLARLLQHAHMTQHHSYVTAQAVCLREWCAAAVLYSRPLAKKAD